MKMYDKIMELPVHYRPLFFKMFEFAEIDPKKVEYTDKWYHDNTWTEEQMHKYMDWAEDYVWKNRRKFKIYTKGQLSKEIAWLIFSYGLRIK